MNLRNRWCLGLALVLVVASSGGAAAKSSSAGSWPVIRVELSYTGMNWETSERVDKSLVLTDREPFLPAKNYPCPAPRAVALPGRLGAAAIPLSATVNRKEFGDFTAGQAVLPSRLMGTGRLPVKRLLVRAGLGKGKKPPAATDDVVAGRGRGLSAANRHCMNQP